MVSPSCYGPETIKTYIRNTEKAQYSGHNTPLGCYSDQGPYVRGQYYGQGEYCGLSTASEVFLIFTTQLYQVFFFYLNYISDEPEVFLPKYFQAAILHAAHFRRVVKNTEVTQISEFTLGWQCFLDSDMLV